MPQNLIAIKIAQSAILSAVSIAVPSLSLGGNYIEFIGKTMIIDEAYLR